jgi:triphosphoribosyl-dephospho-CoA synthetase
MRDTRLNLMLHPIFSTLIQRPDLLAGHVMAYGDLFGQEIRAARNQLGRRALAWMLALVCVGVFMSMTGIALMLGVLNHQFHWILLAVPGAALLATALAVGLAQKPLDTEHFTELKAQLRSDASALRRAT